MKLGMTKKAIIGLGLLSLGSLSHAYEFADGYEAASAEEYGKAAKIWHSLAVKGNPDAQFNLAMIYHSGVAGKLDEKQAVEWYEKAASNGHVQAQEYLAVAYREGWFGLQKDAKKADFWDAKSTQ